MKSACLPCRRSGVRVSSAAFGAPASDSPHREFDAGASSAHTSPTVLQKTCSLCAEAKPVEDFNRDRTKRDGRQSLCRICQKGNYRRGSNRERTLERTKRYQQENPDARRAHHAVEHAIAKGKMIRGFCECCGTEKADAHHWKGYDHPLDVQWLCRSCHVTLEPRRGVAA